jgi:hypothetical protein
MQANRRVHDARIIFSDLAVKRHGAADTIFLQNLHQPPDADPVAVVAARVVTDVGGSGAQLDVENARY